MAQIASRSCDDGEFVSDIHRHRMGTPQSEYRMEAASAGGGSLGGSGVGTEVGFLFAVDAFVLLGCTWSRPRSLLM